MKTTIEQRLAELPPLTAGQHHSLDDGVCAMEAAAYLAGEPWTDHPECVCPTIGAFLRAWNDDLSDADRDRLIRLLIPRIVGSRSTPAVKVRRSWMVLDWLIREHAPVWLALVPGLAPHVEKLRALAEVRDVETVSVAQPALTAASAAARDAWHAASAAAMAASSDTARDAWHAASVAANAAASDTALAASRAAARTVASAAARAAWHVTWAAASDTAADAANAAAMAAARAAASNAWHVASVAASDAWYVARAAARAAASDATRAAARDVLARAVATQQQSALRLIDRMLAVTEGGLA